MLNSSIKNLLQQALNVHDKESDLILIKSDADGIKSALLGGIAFLGREFDEGGAQSKAGRGYSPADLSELGRFLSSSIELIQIMDAVIDGCDDAKNGTN
ncbi:TPA: hypothetical protein ACTXAM_005270 [Raoultella ornithinolytica]|uniref:hypothetical protein n=1 Tax=Klebsiella michiganensis TaxID=1134687 RepID=UPI0015E54AFD|nr:hypothetical protein [Klebsiella michiganensis]QLP50938.1 hypothetical protein HV105_29860 [Klebsiella michiganensis]HBZ0992949.1 hypothetical protein [Klebsiella pneumoniae]